MAEREVKWERKQQEGKGIGAGRSWEAGGEMQETGCRSWYIGAGMQELGCRARMWCSDVVLGCGTGLQDLGCRAGLWHRAALQAPRSRRQCRARPREGAGPAHPAHEQPRPAGSRHLGARNASYRRCRVLRVY